MIRIEYSNSLSALLDFGYQLYQHYPTVYTSSPFYLFSPDYFVIGLNVNSSI